MAIQGTPNILHMVIIAGRGQKDKLMTAISGAGGHFLSISYGRGSVQAGFLSDALGLVHESNKVIIRCLCSCKEADAIMEMLVTDFSFDQPNTGIAYAIPVDILSY